MSTTKTDTTTGQFDPTSMQTFQGLSGALGQSLPGFMTNPFGSPQFGVEQKMGTQQAQNLGGTGMSNLMRNMTASGMAGGASSPAGLEMQQNQARANTGLQSQLGFMNPTMNALQRQQFAMGLGSQYRPLQTGQTSQEKTGGLGTWLPQVAQLAMSLGSMGMGAMGGPGMGSFIDAGGGAGGGMAGVLGSNPQWMGGAGGTGFNPGTFSPFTPPPSSGGGYYNPFS